MIRAIITDVDGYIYHPDKEHFAANSFFIDKAAETMGWKAKEKRKLFYQQMNFSGGSKTKALASLLTGLTELEIIREVESISIRFWNDLQPDDRLKALVDSLVKKGFLLGKLRMEV